MRRVGAVALALFGTAAGALVHVQAQAQTGAAATPGWPSKPVRLIVTFPPGGSSDAAARLVAPKLAERLGQAVVIDNRPGAGGGIGLEAAAKSAPDGHTLVLASAGGLTANPSLYRKLNYDPVKDFLPVVLFGTSPFVLVAHESLPAANARELVALAKSKPGKLSYASGGNGTAMHLSGELLKSTAQVFVVHVPYRGTGPAVLAAMSGETELAVADLASVQQQLKGGRLKALGVMGAKRSSLAPELPTLAETGLPGFESNGWFAVLAPAGTPAPIVARLNAELNTILRSDDMRRQFAVAGLEPLGGTTEELARLMKTETDKWAQVIKVSGAKLD
jgi:tripartite-type tricarboxylate transporter receptor subunit TctC